MGKDERKAGANAWIQTWDNLLLRVAQHMLERKAHPARTVVLLPFGQLLPLARARWAKQFPDGFMPRFETTQTWADRLGHWQPGATDLSFHQGRDWWVARSLLQEAGLTRQLDALAKPLIEQARQLAKLASALPPHMRSDWSKRVQDVLPSLEDEALALESVLMRVAASWAAHSTYATDVLFAEQSGQNFDALMLVHGLQLDPLMQSLQQCHADKSLSLEWRHEAPVGEVGLHACSNGEDEAQRAAWRILEHLLAGRSPVGLLSLDRVLTRRINALLTHCGVQAGSKLSDETGWKLSTTHAASLLITALRACLPGASSDAVLAWLLMAPEFDASQRRQLERTLRRHVIRLWHQFEQGWPEHEGLRQIRLWRTSMQGMRSLTEWLHATRKLLQACGQWEALQADAAGQKLLSVLGWNLDDTSLWQDFPAAQSSMDLAGFVHWCELTLEAARFEPPRAPHPQVIVLPLQQLMGRPLAAVVMPGADEASLPVMPALSGPWTRWQREQLNLPLPQELQAEQQNAWRIALQAPMLDIFWRSSDDEGNAVQASPLVQAWALRSGQALTDAPGPWGEQRCLKPLPVTCPAPAASALPAKALTASSYDQLRKCPYRYFALHLLGLHQDSELDVDIEKRDWGNWLHQCLRYFHEALQAQPSAQRHDLMDMAAKRASKKLKMDVHVGEFLPYFSAWPAVRDAYLQWLREHELQGYVFFAAEQDENAMRDGLQLKGRIDRVDHDAQGRQVLIDYKTEALDKTKNRIKSGSEDTQLAFYVLLTSPEAQAAYLNLSERSAPSWQELPEPARLSQLLLQGMSADMQRIADGEGLPALGQGSVCDWCEVRGLCRKDFWS